MNKMSNSELVALIMSRLSCSKNFAIEYLMERRYNGLSHSKAFAEAQRTCAYIETPTQTNGYTCSASTAFILGTLNEAYTVQGETRYPLVDSAKTNYALEAKYGSD